MDKKTQVSLFFMLGMVVLIAASFLVYVSSTREKTSFNKENEIISRVNPSSLADIKLNVDYCVKEISKQAVTYIGLHGGYYNVPEPKFTYFWDDTPFYAYEGESKVPPIKTIEAQISDYMMEQLPECVNGLKFEDAKLDGKINSVSTTIGMEKVLVNVDYPITVHKGTSETKISDFAAEIPVRLDSMYRIASNISEQLLINKGALCVDCLIDFANGNKFFIDVLLQGNNSIFTIYDNVTTIDGGEYIFSFAAD